ncbi:MAG: putative signal-transducing histidine kinase [halophilic archaeon J07HX5]|nr:MAG: putative signal-transducing histidine kinase [halophilic archaeon J07HX5]
MPAAVIRIDSDRTVGFASEQAESVFGIAPGDNISQCVTEADWKCVGADTAPESRAKLPFRRVFETSEPVEDVRCVMTGVDGNRLTVGINAAPVYDDGAVDSVVCAITDITGDIQQVQTVE